MPKVVDEQLRDLEKRVSGLESNLKAAAAVALVLGAGGAALGTRLWSAIDQEHALERQLNDLKDDSGKLLDAPLAAAKKEIQEFTNTQRASLHVPAQPPTPAGRTTVSASYAARGRQDLVYGQHMRVNFGDEIANNHADVTTSNGWMLNVRRTGTYKVDAFIQIQESTNLHFILRSRRAGTLLPDQNGTEANVDRADLVGNIRLDAGDEVWFEAWHSRANTTITGGRCAIQLLRAE
jgi:hypothetical protein